MGDTAGHLLDNAYGQLLDIVFPPRCAGCRTWSSGLFCPACERTLVPIAAPFCSSCGIPFDPLAQTASQCPDCRSTYSRRAPSLRILRSAYTFEGALRHAVHRFKYQGKVALAPALADRLHTYLTHQPVGAPVIPSADLELLIPVPLHPWRRYRRGYNQSELLARELGQRLGVPAAVLLSRERHTTPQVELSARDRASNVAGAFAADADGVAALEPGNRPVLLIDDVCTTGSTLRECASVLAACGLQHVYALTLARQL